MPASSPTLRRAPQLSPKFPTPARFKSEPLQYAKVRVFYRSSVAIGDLIPQYHTRENLGVRIDVTLPYVRTPHGAVDEESGMVEDGYFPVKEFHLSAAGIAGIELTGDATIPYQLRLDPRVPEPFVPFMTETSERP